MKAADLLNKQRTYFISGATQSVHFRIHQLQTLKTMIKQHEEELMETVFNDFKKPKEETYATEIGILYQEINYTLKHLKKWTKPKKVSGNLLSFPSKSYTIAEPYGNVLIIAPWNYPIQLTLLPLVGAIAAGNTAVIKPSEITPNTSKVLKEITETWFKEEFIGVMEGGVEVNQELLAQDFNYIFFTGSTRVGKIVMEAAAKNLTPVTLELGGKSPCIVDETADLKTAAKRIAWGKFVNAGQTCVAPDYLLLHDGIRHEFLTYLKEAIQEFYGDDSQKSTDYPRIVNQNHFKRLVGYLDDGDILIGGRHVAEERYVEPTVLTNVKKDAPVMEEEIFGPILPVFTFRELPEALRLISKHPKPLALYIFTNNKDHEQLVLSRCSFGGGVVNDVVIHLANHHLPFGGVGNSGIGAYHGKHSFDTFSHTKSIMKKPFWPDLPFRYPPYQGKLKWLKRLLK